MLRRGELRGQSVAAVLRAAAAERLSGGIDFHTSEPGCVHLVGGDAYLVVATGAAAVDDPVMAPGVDEATALHSSVEVLSRMVEETDGWYYFHPLNHHELRGSWRWSVEGLISGAERGQDPAPARPQPPAPALLALAALPPGGPISADAWNVMRALVPATSLPELERRLGWNRDRLRPVLLNMATSGLIAPAHVGTEARELILPEGPDALDEVHPEPGPGPVHAPVAHDVGWGQPAPDAAPDAAWAAPQPVDATQGSTFVLEPSEVAPPMPDHVRSAVAAAMSSLEAPRPIPPPHAMPDRRTALRRLIRSLRPAS